MPAGLLAAGGALRLARADDAVQGFTFPITLTLDVA